MTEDFVQAWLPYIETEPDATLHYAYFLGLKDFEIVSGRSRVEAIANITNRLRSWTAARLVLHKPLTWPHVSCT